MTTGHDAPSLLPARVRVASRVPQIAQHVGQLVRLPTTVINPEQPPQHETILWVATDMADIASVTSLHNDHLLWGVVAWGLSEAAVLRLVNIAPRLAVGGGDDLAARLAAFDESARESERTVTTILAGLEDALRS